MTTPPSAEVLLPTLDKLNVKLPDNINAHQVAADWLSAFSKSVYSGDVDRVVAHILDDGLWRDMLALTWNLRTLHGSARIHDLLKARLSLTKITGIRLAEDPVRAPSVFTGIPGVMWVQGLFDFQTAVGMGSGVFRIVPTPNGLWKAHVVYTNLESLHVGPPKVGPLRNHDPSHGSHWIDNRAKEAAFEHSDPKVLIIGAGHSGLDVAARLKYLNIPALVVEKHPRIGDSWRERYQALCLHDSVWYDHLPYMNFPSTWPVHAPSAKLADWLESYANALELNVRTSTAVESVRRDENKDEWIVTTIKSDGSRRILRPKYVVFAIGLGGNHPNMPNIPGLDEFQGKILHTTTHKSGKDFFNKKVVVVGACTSAHDVAEDLHNHGVDVTMVQRSSTCIVSVTKGLPVMFGGLYAEDGPPVDIADRLGASVPVHVLKIIHQHGMLQVAELDKDIIHGLEGVGFKTNMGEDDSGFLYLAYERGGGYYLDTGASQLIIDGKIKLKSGSVQRLSNDSVVFEDGSFLKADVVIFATGLGDVRVPARKLLGGELGSKLKRVWGLDPEGELNSVYRDSGLPNLYFIMGNLALCRFHSLHLALQIQAKEAGLSVIPYVD